MRVTVNPDAQASSDFGYAAPGDYTLRIKDCKEKTKPGGEWPYLEWQFVFADPNVKAVEEGKAVGSVFEVTSLKPDAQFNLRDLCEALGLTWGDFDTDVTKGMEFRARVGTEIYNKRIKNVIEKYEKR